MRPTVARASSGIRDPRRVPRIGKYIPTVASKAQNAQKRIGRFVLVALVTSARAATRHVIIAKVACLFTEDSVPASAANA
jgi:hypothetical protein